MFTYKKLYAMQHPECSIEEIDNMVNVKCVSTEYANITEPYFCPHKSLEEISRYKDELPSNPCELCWNSFSSQPDDLLCIEIEEAEHKNASHHPHIKDSGNRRQFKTGAVRDIQEGKGRCDLLPLDVIDEYMKEDNVLGWISKFKEDGSISCLYYALNESKIFEDKYTMILEVAKHFEEGCKKYGENNWQKGIPVRCYIDSAVRHFLKYKRGDTDEPHDRAFVWNILCCIWTCKHMPELNEYSISESNKKGD